MTILEKWRFYLSDIEAPDIYINWSFYYTIAAALQRRVWLGVDRFKVYPNLFVILVAPPAVGKTMPCRIGRDILKTFSSSRKNPETKKDELVAAIPIAPDSTTLEGFTKHIADKCNRRFMIGQQPYIHYSMAFFSEELAVLFKEGSDDMVKFLLQGYDANQYERITKGQGEDIIPNICINLLAATYPDFLDSSVGKKLVDSGFSSRTLFIWATKPRFRRAFIEITKDQQQAYKEVTEYIEKVTMVAGEMTMAPETKAFFKEWYETKIDIEIENAHASLKTYYKRKKVHMMKLMMMFHFAGDGLGSLEIQPISFVEALESLSGIEIEMHKALSGAGKNFLHKVSEEILEQLKEGGQCSYKTLRLNFDKDVTGDQLTECLDYLVTTGQIVNAAQGVFALSKPSSSH